MTDTSKPLAQNKVFVFGSNEAGIHGGGAALVAWKVHKASYGKSYGHTGQTFAIPTKDEFIKDTLPLGTIECYVAGFKAYAASKRKLIFIVTRIGCGLAGLKDEQVAPLFYGSPLNCQFDEAWRPWLGDDYTYWGSVP